MAAFPMHLFVCLLVEKKSLAAKRALHWLQQQQLDTIPQLLQAP
jgi:hypothetical protein